MIGDITLGTAAGNVPVLDGSGKLVSGVVPVSAIDGKIIARYYDEDVVHGTTTTAIPNDDTIPQNTEGAATDLSITTNTLISSSNRLRVRVTGCIANGTADRAMVMALFNGGASAVRVAAGRSAMADALFPLSLEYEYAPGATTAVTFTVRYGSDGGTCAKNGVDSGRRYGAILGWTMIVEEIEV